VVRRILFAKLGMHWRRDFERQPVRRGEAVSKHETRYKATLDTIAVFNSHVALVDEGLLVGVTLVVRRRAATKERDESLDTEFSTLLLIRIGLLTRMYRVQ
jgi:hypothetical protein